MAADAAGKTLQQAERLESLGSLRRRLLADPESVPDRVLAELGEDRRAGARALRQAILRVRDARQATSRRVHGMRALELELVRQGCLRVAGVDEAGVGPLAPRRHQSARVP